MRADKAELLETMRADKREVLEAIRDTEQRLSHRRDRHEDRTDAQIETLRRELNQSAIEQPVAGDD